MPRSKSLTLADIDFAKSARRGKGRPVTVDEHGVPSRTRIILEAERLFADRGIEGVSLREVCQAARQGNSNAIQYHFGSREGLVFAIFAHRLAEMEPMRRAMIEAARGADLLRDARTLLAIFFKPYLDLTDSEGRHNYASFMSEYLVRFRPLGLPHAADDTAQYAPALGEATRLIHACASHLNVGSIRDRLEIVHLIFFNMIVRWDQSLMAAAERPSLAVLVEEALDLATTAYLVTASSSSSRRPSQDLGGKGAGD